MNGKDLRHQLCCCWYLLKYTKIIKSEGRKDEIVDSCLSYKKETVGTSLLFIALLLNLKAISCLVGDPWQLWWHFQLSAADCSCSVQFVYNPMHKTACLAYRCSAVEHMCMWLAHCINLFERPAQLPMCLNHVDCWHCQKIVKNTGGLPGTFAAFLGTRREVTFSSWILISGLGKCSGVLLNALASCPSHVTFGFWWCWWMGYWNGSED